MASSAEQQAKNNSSQSLTIAIAVALLRSKLIQKPPPLPSTDAQSDALKWKQKAKERKKEVLRLKDDLKQAEDRVQCDLFPVSASCKCCFFDNLGKSSTMQSGDSLHRRFSSVLHRRFLRQVRWREHKRRRNASVQQQHFSERNWEDEMERFGASVDFLVELCDTVSSVEEATFTNWSHLATDFILASLKNLLLNGKNAESIEGIINSLIVNLLKRTHATSQGHELHHLKTDVQFYIQHLLRKLGSEPYVGQRIIFSVSRRIFALAENLPFMDPFDENVPTIHSCMYVMIQLIEFLVSDRVLTWPDAEGFDTAMFEEWVTSLLHARKALELLESRHGLYVLYMDRVIGEVGKQVGQVSSLQKLLNPDLIRKLFR